MEEYKHKRPVIGENEREYIVENIKAVDETIIAHTLDKVEMLKKLKFDAVFIGDDWKGNPRWEKTREELSAYGVDVVFLPHTEGVCSTKLRKEVDKRVE